MSQNNTLCFSSARFIIPWFPYMDSIRQVSMFQTFIRLFSCFKVLRCFFIYSTQPPSPVPYTYNIRCRSVQRWGVGFGGSTTPPWIRKSMVSRRILGPNKCVRPWFVAACPLQSHHTFKDWKTELNLDFTINNIKLYQNWRVIKRNNPRTSQFADWRENWKLKRKSFFWIFKRTSLIWRSERTSSFLRSWKIKVAL